MLAKAVVERISVPVLLDQISRPVSAWCAVPLSLESISLHRKNSLNHCATQAHARTHDIFERKPMKVAFLKKLNIMCFFVLTCI